MSMNSLQMMTLNIIPGVTRSVVMKIIENTSYDKEFSMGQLFVYLKDNNIIDELMSYEKFEEFTCKAEDIIEKHKKSGIKITSYYEDHYPESFRETRNEQGTKKMPPFLLFYKGNISLLNTVCVTVIGSRSCTESAFHAGENIAECFVKEGFTIVSGLALGCDTSAHLGALNAGGKTIAILGHGLDTVYPSKNTFLSERILNNDGLLVSEYPMGQKVSPYKLVERDRLQAGLSLATVVVQTGMHGGSMHAANAALNSNRPLFVVIHDDEETLHHENTRGNFALLDKGAKPISVNDNVDHISYEIKTSAINK